MSERDPLPDDRHDTLVSTREERPGIRVFDAVAGLLVGLVAGFVVALAWVVTRAVLLDVYIHAFEEIAGWPGLPLPALAIAGAALGATGHLIPPTIGALLGGAVGTGLGALAGLAVTSDPSAPWAGGTIGAGAGLLIGAALSAAPPARRVGGGLQWVGRRIWLRRRAAAVVIVIFAGVIAASLLDRDVVVPPAFLDTGAVEPPDTSLVSDVVLFVGDAGNGTLRTLPALARLREDVERWSRALGPDGRVVVVYLGDIVYPAGLSAPDDPTWSRDSTRLAAQVEVVAGEHARRAGARGIFVMGNHDWGQDDDFDGAVRVHRMAEFLERRRAEGPLVSVEPAAGTGGPSVLDLGDRIRLVFLDTAWWLLDAEPDAKDQVIEGVAAALAGAGGREVVLAAHHPFESGGTHGALTEIGATVGVRTVLSQSGALLQDLRSEPYRELRARLLEVFGRVGRPALFAGGHDHSLQVVRTEDPEGPRISLVSGAMSKLSGVGLVAGTLFAQSIPGYAVLLVHEDGRLMLRMEAAPSEYLSCPADEAAVVEQADAAPDGGGCMSEGVAAFRTVWVGPI